MSSESYFLKYKKFFRVSVFRNIKVTEIQKILGVSISWNIRKAFFWGNIRNFFGVLVFGNISTAFFWENIINFLILEYKKFFQGRFFYFSILDLKVQGCISGNTRKAFFWKNIIHFLILESKIFISRNMRKFFRGGFFLFFELWCKSPA